MRRIRLTVAYDGTAYCGSQIQPNGATIEEKLNEALRLLTGTDCTVMMASRTDAGVHARGNIAVFDTEMQMDAGKFTFALNDRLPADIRIQKSEEVPPDWHPRKQNCIKTYEYRIFNSRVPDPLVRLYSHFCYYDLDVEKMKRAASFLIGEHDFKSFCSARSQSENTVRTVYAVSLERNGNMIVMKISGSGFLYNMVRIIAGTLMRIGTGMWPPEKMHDILAAKDRKEAGPNADAAGLTLVKIEYEKNLQQVLRAENEEWNYVLDQRETESTGRTFFLVKHCLDSEYSGLLMREIHQAWRNGAKEIYVADAEKPGRLKPGQSYGFYTLQEIVCIERKVDGVNISQWARTENPKFSPESMEE